MPSDLPDSPHPAAAAVLNVMPIDPDDAGHTLTGWEIERPVYADGERHDPNVPDEYTVPVFGDPEPLAAKYAATSHREIAAHAEEIRHYNGFTTAEDVADWLLARADEIEGTSR